MDPFDRLDPALRQLAPARADLSLGALGATRESLNQRRRETALTVDDSGVDVADGSLGSVPVRIYRRHGERSPAPAVVYCHSGAFVLGNLDTDHRQCVELARRGGCTVISADYRLAPENPYPAAVLDATAVLVWVAENARELDVDANRLAVAGSSAGAALAAGLAQRAAAGELPEIVFQLLHQPVLDDRPTASKQEFVDTPGFDGPATRLMWRYYLAGTAASSAAVPGRSNELEGMAAAFVSCSELDPLRDEAVDYARRLSAAGVETALHVFEKTCHGFDSLLPEWDVSQRLFELQGTALRRALTG
ncbi:MAG: alpha/beta hydrolase [Mycobacterium sp.]